MLILAVFFTIFHTGGFAFMSGFENFNGPDVVFSHQVFGAHSGLANSPLDASVSVDDLQ